jgi:hypothetical protein
MLNVIGENRWLLSLAGDAESCPEVWSGRVRSLHAMLRFYSEYCGDREVRASSHGS